MRDPLQQALVDLLMRGVFASMRYGTEIISANQFYWRMEEEAEIELVLLQTHLRAVMKTLAPHRAEHFTSLRRIIRELELFCGKTEERKSKRKDATGKWVSVPTCRVLPSRRDALDHALAKSLITEEEYNAAVVRPDEFCSAHSRGGPIFGLRGIELCGAPEWRLKSVSGLSRSHLSRLSDHELTNNFCPHSARGISNGAGASATRSVHPIGKILALEVRKVRKASRPHAPHKRGAYSLSGRAR